MPEHDAALVTSLGASIAWRQFRFADVAILCQRYLELPPGSETDYLSRHELEVKLAHANLLLGKVDLGIRQFEDALTQQINYPQKIRLIRIRSELVLGLYDLGEDNLPDPSISNFIANLLRQIEGHAQKAPLAEQATTNAELIEILIS